MTKPKGSPPRLPEPRYLPLPPRLYRSRDDYLIHLLISLLPPSLLSPPPLPLFAHRRDAFTHEQRTGGGGREERERERRKTGSPFECRPSREGKGRGGRRRTTEGKRREGGGRSYRAKGSAADRPQQLLCKPGQ